MTLTHTLTAFNTATASENKIHDDAVAARFGFTGGLVPGVDVFGYMAHVPLAAWGRVWLTEGGMHARFLKPVFDGDAVTASGAGKPVDDPALLDEMELSVTARGRGVLCASGSASRYVSGAAPDILPAAAMPEAAAKPKASFDSLKPGAVLGTLHDLYTRDAGAQHIADIREDLEPFEGGVIANPAWLLRRANYILAENVQLGPWIHSESRIRMHGLLTDGEALETRAVVVENAEKGGHLIVTLDFTQSAGDRLVMSGRHWAIYEPRQVRGAG